MAKENTIAAQKTPDLLESLKAGTKAQRMAARGRPKKPDAMTNAERQAKFRASRAAVQVGDTMSATIKRLAGQFDLSEQEVTRELLRFALCNRNWSQTGFSVTVTKNPL